MTLPPRSYVKRGRDRRLRSDAHRRFVRSHMCILHDRGQCNGAIDCCHNRDECPEYGMGIKPSDVWCYSACRKHATEAEKREGAFGLKYGVDVLALCLEFAMKSPDKNVREAAKLVRFLPPKAAE